MERHLNLIQTEYKEIEKRVLPRFPFCQMIFKNESNNGPALFFEVKDVSYSGIQLALKIGEITYKAGDTIRGQLNWKTVKMNIEGTVKWVNENRIGVSFDLKTQKEMKHFISFENIVASMRALHDPILKLDMPNSLKYWLRSDGPVEIFMWTHASGEFSRIQMILLDSFVEWNDGEGTRTGKVVTQRDLDTPLTFEDEFTFQFDQTVQVSKISFGLSLVDHIGQVFLPKEAIEFLKRKLSIH